MSSYCCLLSREYKWRVLCCKSTNLPVPYPILLGTVHHTREEERVLYASNGEKLPQFSPVPRLDARIGSCRCDFLCREGSTGLPTYAQLGEVSPKVDVYVFGVILFELISAKEAIVKSDSSTESAGLVSLFEDVLSQPDAREQLKKLVDARLGDDYPLTQYLSCLN